MSFSKAASISKSVPGSRSAVVIAAVVCLMNKRQAFALVVCFLTSTVMRSVISRICFGLVVGMVRSMCIV